jgi:DNA (cytosine-5)-methyltransferase 1
VKYLSVCSGIEAASVAWHTLGWELAAFCEIEAFPSAVLAHRYPNVPNYGDFTRLTDAAHPIHGAGVDLLVGGTPCQAFSVAGLRRGLADPRGGLTLEFVRLAQALRPKWIVWENVPGVLSQDGGRAFGAFLGALGELGYGFAYRVLDAQYARVDGYPHAVPQRRKRVFVVGCAGEAAARAAAVLFEPEGVRGNTPTRRASRKGAAADAAGGFEVCGTLSDGAHHGGGLNGQDAYTGRILPVVPYDLFQVTAPINCQNRDQNRPCHTLARDNAAHAAVVTATPAYDPCPTLTSRMQGSSGWAPYNEDAHLVAHAGSVPRMSVRRLTPTECERLQGFPDGWTAIPWKGKSASECPDGPRYKALGNSMACNVMRWIGTRIAMVDAIEG